jgi:hypothetical protein
MSRDVTLISKKGNFVSYKTENVLHKHSKNGMSRDFQIISASFGSFGQVSEVSAKFW